MSRWHTYIRNGAVLVLYTLSAFFFFGRLLYPTPQVYLNPEYGASDISHFNIPVRMEYARALHEGHMPLWSKNMGGGFPLYAESQIGAWYLPNLIVYRLFSFWTAFSLSYVIAWIMGMFGMYAWLYQRTGHRWASVIGGWVYVFSGFFIGHLNHINMLQTASLIPWVLLTYEYARQKHMWAWPLTAFLIAQHICAGHLQTSFIMGCMMLLLECVQSYENNVSLKKLVWHIMRIVLLFICAGCISAIQILPSLELHGLSIRSDVFSLNETIHFSLHPRMFTTLLLPFSQGDLAHGTFTFLKKLSTTGAIFWESWMYMGWIVLVGLVASLRLVLTNDRKRIIGYWLCLLLCAGLMTARYSPLYFVFSIPPFNFFTTPARWLVGFNLCAVLLGVEVLRRSPRYVSYVCAVALCVDVLFVWYPYGVRIPVDQIAQPPQTLRYIQSDTSLSQAEKRVMSISAGEWSSEFVRNGWKAGKKYPAFFNEISPNMNLIWGINHEHEYVGRIWTQRKYIFDQYFAGLTIPDTNDPRRIVADHLINRASIDYLISTKPLSRLKTPEVYTYRDKRVPDVTYHVYKNNQSKPRFWLTDQVTDVRSVEDIIDTLTSKESDDGVVFAEKEIFTDHMPKTALVSEVRVQSDTNLSTALRINTNKPAVFVSTDTYYPGWIAYIDGVASPVYPLNIAQRGIVVPAGEHDIRFEYKPESYARGAWISGISLLIILAGFVLLIVQERSSASAIS